MFKLICFIQYDSKQVHSAPDEKKTTVACRNQIMLMLMVRSYPCDMNILPHFTICLTAWPRKFFRGTNGEASCDWDIYFCCTWADIVPQKPKILTHLYKNNFTCYILIRTNEISVLLIRQVFLFHARHFPVARRLRSKPQHDSDNQSPMPRY